MIGRAQPRMAPAKVIDQASGDWRSHETRTNSLAMFDILAADFVLIVLHARISNATGFARRCLEETNVLHYAQGQEFGRHYDFFAPDNPAFEQEVASKGQRAGTFLIYLNDGFEGGETEFPKLGWRYKGLPGDALYFRNVLPSGAPDTQTLHAGIAPIKGEKWLLSQWIRTHPPLRAATP